LHCAWAGQLPVWPGQVKRRSRIGARRIVNDFNGHFFNQALSLRNFYDIFSHSNTL